MGSCMCVSINTPSIETRCISYVSLFLIYCILQVSLVFLFKYSFLILKVLVPYPDFCAVHSGYTSKLQVYYWRYGRSRVFGAREATWRRETVLFLRCWFHCDFGQPLAQQEETCPHIRDSGQRLLLCGGKRHGFMWAGKASEQWAVMLLWSHLSLYAEKGWQQEEYLQMQVFCAPPCLCRFPFSFQWEALFAFINFSSIIISPLRRNLHSLLSLSFLPNYSPAPLPHHPFLTLTPFSCTIVPTPLPNPTPTLFLLLFLPLCSRYCLVQHLCLEALNLVGSLGLKAVQNFPNHWQKQVTVHCSVFSSQNELLWNEVCHLENLKHKRNSQRLKKERT